MIDYSNKIFEVIDQVHHIVAKEMALPIYMDSHQGNHSVYIEPISDNLLEILTNGQNRQYTVLISYELTSRSQTHPTCLLYTSPSPRDGLLSRMPSSA